MAKDIYLEETGRTSAGPLYSLQNLTAMDVVVMHELLASQRHTGHLILQNAPKNGLVHQRMSALMGRLNLLVDAIKKPC